MSFATSQVTSSLDTQDFFTTTLLQQVVGSTDTNIYLTALPTPTEAFLVIDPLNTQGTGSREIIYYNSLGANYVTCPSASTGRGIGGTTAQQHNQGVEVRMATVAEYWRCLRDGYALGAGSVTYPKLSNLDKVSVYNTSGAQTVGTSSATAITFAQELYKTVTGMHSTSVNTSRLIALTTGYYRIIGNIGWGIESATGVTEAWIRVNGTTTIALNSAAGVTADNGANSLSIDYFLNANDYIELIGWQNSGINKTVTPGQLRTNLSMALFP